MTLSIFLLLVYILGSFPTAFIVIKLTHNIDIRKAGSGNVGTLNSYEVTNSKKIGLIVLIIDLFKGIIAVSLSKIFFPNDFSASGLSIVFAVLGHCYSIWIKFSGGRGLATAAGGMLFLSPLILVLWLISWYLTKKIVANIHIANVTATLFVVLISIFISDQLNIITFPPAERNIIFTSLILLIMIIILSKHLKPIKELLKKTADKNL